MADLDPSTPIPMPATPDRATSSPLSLNLTTSTLSSLIPTTPIATASTATALTAPAVSSLRSTPASTLQSPPAIPVQGLVPSDEQKRTYRFRGLELIATNNIYALPDPIIDPRTRWPARRATDVCDNEQFAQCWKEHLSAPIVQYLASNVESWTLNILRSGFPDAEDPLRTPIVVYLKTGLTLADKPVTEELALRIIRVVASIILEFWQGESIYIDVCKTQRSSTSDQLAEFSYLSDIPPRYYTRYPPFPGCSIGTGNQAGTLTGYVKHGDEFYKSTCYHVGGPRGTQLSSPALYQHDAIKEALEKLVPSLLSISRLGRISPRLLGLVSGPLHYGAYWYKIWKACRAWDPDCGTVTSSSGGLLGGYNWCLTKFEGKPGQNYNRHVPLHQLDASSGFQFHSVHYFSSSAITTAESYFAYGPSFKPIRSTPLKAFEVCFKPPSCTTKDWTVGRVNSIDMITQQNSTVSPQEQYCIVSGGLDIKAVVSAEGDSGSIILDKDYQPVAVLYAGYEATNINQDITCAVHLSTILADMERVNG
ncbi:hypothetical protein BKA61DRAFT_655275 [Leptodontidium sp. MPI-SDFR-AT-0119]|nr:hypothetical protein BKA61DRAFT_655275 [Leptodontidium sp. MPI-SDFR-AT-0119]